MSGGLRASLPMYDWPELHKATDRFWAVLRDNLIQRGIAAPEHLERTEDNAQFWTSPNLLLSQTCGYPYIARLHDHVELVATPHYDVAGCDGPNYSSAIVVRRDAQGKDLQDFADGTLAYNGADSLSGLRCLVPMVGEPIPYFRDTMVSGSHRQSALAVAQGRADVAAIDAVSWHYFQNFEPEAATKLRTIGWSPSFPALPFVCATSRSNVEKACLWDALDSSTNSPQNDDVASDFRYNLRLKAVSHPDFSSYSSLTALLPQSG